MARRTPTARWRTPLAVFVIATCAGACGEPPAPPAAEAASSSLTKTTVSDRSGRLNGFPCGKCHQHTDAGATADADARKHDEITPKHFAGADRCDLCHAGGKRERLKLLAGDEVTFGNLHRVCGQCHGEKLTDWKTGAHGKHVGSFRGARHRLTCTDCHDAHRPARPIVEAAPPPPRPALGIDKGAH